MNIGEVAVIGGGLMGTGIAQVISAGGFKVFVCDISSDLLDRSERGIDLQLKKLAEKGKISHEEAIGILGRITFTVDLRMAVQNADFIIEAVPENLALKKKIFGELDELAKHSALFASNTSELSIASISDGCARKEKVIGTHWFFPPQIMRLIEVVLGPETSKETLETTLTFCAKLGKETVVCKDTQGFITSRAISAMIAECLRIYEEGIASVEDIDKAMRLGFNHPIGPFQLADMSGVDVVYHSLEGLSAAFGDRFKPTETMSKLVAQGELGRKTGKGFYEYASK